MCCLVAAWSWPVIGDRRLHSYKPYYCGFTIQATQTPGDILVNPDENINCIIGACA
jgi:hypothetical protein